MQYKKSNYRSWLIDEEGFPTSGTVRQKLEFLIGYGILAPSQHNTQPWLFDIKDNTITIRPDLGRRLAIGDPYNSGLYISLGACAENIIQAAERFGVSLHTEIIGDAVQLTITESVTTAQSTNALTENILHRHSEKSIYDGKKIPVAVLNELMATKDDLVEIKLVTEPSDISTLTRLHGEAAAKIADNDAFVRELVGWLRTNNTRAYDGMPGFVAGNSALKSIVGKVLLNRKPAIFKKAVPHEIKLMASAGAIAVWGVYATRPADYIAAGQRIERFWLEAVGHGLVAHPLSAVISTSESIQGLIELTGMTSHPVFLLRLGCGPDKLLHTPRKAPICN